MPVDIRRLSWARRLAADYSYDFSRVAPFFAGNPAVPSDWQAAIVRRQAQPYPAGAHVNDAAELVDQGPGLLRRDAEAEHLDRDQTISTGFVSTKERSEDANANLMQHPKWAERTSG